jgi:hypothetical protein
LGKQADDALLQRIANWKTAYTDDTTGVLAAIEAMLWDHAAFRTAIRSVNLASQRQRAEVPDGDSPSLNQMFLIYWQRVTGPVCFSGLGRCSIRTHLLDLAGFIHFGRSSMT